MQSPGLGLKLFLPNDHLRAKLKTSATNQTAKYSCLCHNTYSRIRPRLERAHGKKQVEYFTGSRRQIRAWFDGGVAGKRAENYAKAAPLSVTFALGPQHALNNLEGSVSTLPPSEGPSPGHLSRLIAVQPHFIAVLRTPTALEDEEKAGSGPAPAPAAPDTVLTGRKLVAVFVALLLSLFLIALDQTILSTALPRIASDFNSFSLQGWVASSFILAQTVFLLFYGQVLRIFPSKWVLLAAIVIFDVGSLACGLARNVTMLIAGRTVSGVGAAGIFVALFQTIAQVTTLHDRPRLFGLVGATFGVSSIIGPLIGGALTDRVTWRWIFFLNLPLGGVSLCGVTFLLKAAPPLGADLTKRSYRDLLQQVIRIDYVGATLVAAAVTSLVLALQWGGNTKPWDDKDVIICFVFSGVLTVAFIAWEVLRGEKAMTPTAIFKSRSIYAILVYSFLGRFSLLLFSFYIPIYYQAARGHNATKSGLDLLPFLLGCVLCVIGAGQIVGKFGYYWPFLVASPFFLGVGSGLLYTLNTTTSAAKIIGYQILVGIGTGMAMQNSLLAMQVEFKDAPRLLGQATSMASFAQFLGGTLGLGVAEPVFASELSKYLLQYAPGAPAAIVKESPTAIYSGALPESMIAGVVESYTRSLRLVFVLGVPVAGLAFISALFIKNIRIVKTVAPASQGEKAEAGDPEEGRAVKSV